MATVKRGILTRAPEWWKHLRWEKRHAWKRERQAARAEAERDMAALQTVADSSGNVFEDLGRPDAKAKKAKVLNDLLAKFDRAKHGHAPMLDDEPVGNETRGSTLT